ncbi:MAG: hypothetical protein EBX40_00820 [Gammaproteobacteria bacterium]|nr:hypothetical protein [Gammaproteobacteria bacterium]
MSIYRHIFKWIAMTLCLVMLTGCSSAMPDVNSDMAVQTLTQLFGLNLSQILSNTADMSQSDFVIPILFGSFNHVLLSVLLVLFAYIAIAGTIYTAQDGTFLGKKWAKTWLPIRAILGAVLVIPVKSGFCIAQYIMLCLVYVGIYMGTHVWNTVTDKIENQHAVPAATSQMQNQVKVALAEIIYNDEMKGIISNLVNTQGTGSDCQKGTNEVTCTLKTKSTIDDAWFNRFKASLYQAATTGNVCKGDSTCTTELSNFAGSNSTWPHPYYAYQTQGYKNYRQFLLPATVDETDIYHLQLTWDQPDNSLATQALNDLKSDPGINAVMSASYYDINNPTQGDAQAVSEALNNEINTITQQIRVPHFVPGLLPSKTPSSDSATSCEETLTVGEGGWWCASNQYLAVDNELASNMQAYYNELQAFTDGNVGQTGITTEAKATPTLYSFNGTIIGISNPDAWVKGGAFSNLSISNTPLSLDTKLPAYTGGTRWSDIYNQIVALTQSGQFKGQDLNRLNNLIGVLPSAGDSGDYAAHLTILFYLKKSADPAAPILDPVKDAALMNQLYNLLRFISDSGSWTTGSDPSASSPTGQAFGDKDVTGLSFHDLLSNLFQGLLGKTTTGQDIGNVMEQLYNLGTNDSCDNPISCHFSMIQNAQVVGVNLIGGVVGAMENIYQNFANDFTNIVKSAETSQAQVQGVEIAGAILPLLKGVADSANTSDMVAISISLAAVALNLMWLPIVLFVLTGLFVSGITFALLIPLTPYVLFWSGKVAWLLLVIEALVAAPLMALGIAYPDGHDIFGMAEPGIKLSFNVVLMPVLMIIGLIAGIVLTYVVVHFSAEGFHVVASNILAMIPPDSGTQDLGEVKNAATQTAREGLQSGGQALTQGTQAQQGLAKGQAEGLTQQGYQEAGSWGGITGEASSLGQTLMQ